MATLCNANFKSGWILLLSVGSFLQLNLVSSLKPNFNRSEIIKYIEEETIIADRLLVGYDKRFLPTLPGVPLEVHLQIVISDVLKVENMEAEMIIFIRQNWYDHRLMHNYTQDKLKVREHFMDKIWLPDIRIINLKEAKRFEGFGGINMNIYRDGRVYFSQLVHVITSCPMNLHKFPMDRQTCFLNFSTFAYGSNHLNFTSSGKKTQVRQHKLPQFELVEAIEYEEEKSIKFTVALTFQRRAGYYILQIYIPASFLVILSWLSFFMEASNIADRLALEITMILSTVFLLDGINDSVTHVSYAKASDWFVIVSFMFIFVALLETMLVYRLSIMETKKRKRAAGVRAVREKQLSVIFLKTEDEVRMAEHKLNHVDENENQSNMAINHAINTNEGASRKCCVLNCSASRWIDKTCLVMFPMMYITFNAIYWQYYMP